MEQHDSLSQPLLSTSSSSFFTAVSTTTGHKNDAEDVKFCFTSNTAIISRLLFVVFICIISVWANYEAAKGFDVTIINDSKDSLAGKRFELFYISNDKATRILLNASAFVENLLYPDHGNDHTKKKVHRVTLRLTDLKVPSKMFTVETSKSDEFVINISPSIMGYADVNYSIISALQRGMARIWLWDGESRAPPRLMNGLVEYISMLAGFSQRKVFVGGDESPEFSNLWWDDEDPKVVAHFLDYCEGHNKGFIQRLNQAMRERWDNRTVDDATGIEAKYLCDSFKKLYDPSIH